MKAKLLFFICAMSSSVMGGGIEYFNSRNVHPASYRVLCAGDSLTLHVDYPNVWDRWCGMAATAPSNDYAHLVCAGIQSSMPAPVELFAVYGGTASNLLTALSGLSGLYDTIVIQTGENDTLNDSFKDYFKKCIARATSMLSGKNGSCIVVTGDWYSPSISQWQKSFVSTNALCEFRDLSVLYADPLNKGWGGVYNVPAVASHPNNRGHALIAQNILDAWTSRRAAQRNGATVFCVK